MPVVELFVGARVDPSFGPIIAVGTGGIGVELYRDVAIRVCPVGKEEALEAIAATRIGQLLEGFRGRPAGDKEAAASTISAISQFASDFASEISEVEVNPLAVFSVGAGCSALDCVIIRH
jgi:acetate---CoA ligase (ADP-forming)